mgnify:FL=1
MSAENESIPVDVTVNANLAESCKETCSMEMVEDRVNDMVNQVLGNYAMGRSMYPVGMDDGMSTTITIEAGITCPGGRRKFFGGFKCALESTCTLEAVSERAAPENTETE